MATWGGFSDREVSEVKVKLNSVSKKRAAPTKIKQAYASKDQHEDVQGTGNKKSDELPIRNIEDRIIAETVNRNESPAAGPELNEQQCMPDQNRSGDESNSESNHSLSVDSVEVLKISQEHQQKLKEENLERKLKIENALKERCLKSSEEVKKLQFVRDELLKIDDLVSKDVSVLRERIEEADRDFNKAKKRFDLTEKEYIAAKVAFYEAKERKGLLTEHLSTIISHTEMRKSLKLKHLMSDLQLEDKTLLGESTTRTNDKSPKPSLPIEPIPLGTSMINIQRLD